MRTDINFRSYRIWHVSKGNQLHVSYRNALTSLFCDFHLECDKEPKH